MRYYLLLLFLSVNLFSQERIEQNPIAIELARAFTKDIFDLNGTDIMEPSVVVINSVSNDRFYQSAYIPYKENKFYVRVELNGMFGTVPNSMKTFKPEVPQERYFNDSLVKYLDIDIMNPANTSINDTAAMVSYIFKTLLYDGINQPTGSENKISVPERASTLLGKKRNDALVIPQGGLERLARARFDTINQQFGGLFSVPEEIEQQIIDLLNSFPTYYTLSQGGDINSLLVGVPQFTIGSFYGTEMTLRFVPALDYGEEFGKFSFWGVGISHNFSQYFYDNYERENWQLAAQVAFQGSKLTNEVGITQSEFESNANFFNFNVRTSKMIKNWFEFYAGFSYESVSISNKFQYYLSVETQAQLGLLPYIYDEDGNVIAVGEADPENGYQGDTEPQNTSLDIKNENMKLSLGINKEIGDFMLYAGYSFSRFNIFNFGVAYTIR